MVARMPHSLGLIRIRRSLQNCESLSARCSDVLSLFLSLSSLSVFLSIFRGRSLSLFVHPSHNCMGCLPDAVHFH